MGNLIPPKQSLDEPEIRRGWVGLASCNGVPKFKFNAFGGVPLAPIPFLPNIRLPAHHQAHAHRTNRPAPVALITIEPRNSRG